MLSHLLAPDGGTKVSLVVAVTVIELVPTAWQLGEYDIVRHPPEIAAVQWASEKPQTVKLDEAVEVTCRHHQCSYTRRRMTCSLGQASPTMQLPLKSKY